MGSAFHCSQAQNPARWAALDAGLGYGISATFLEMQCGTGIDAINLAASKIKSGLADIVIAGGFESHSNRFAKFSMSVASLQIDSSCADQAAVVSSSRRAAGDGDYC